MPRRKRQKVLKEAAEDEVTVCGHPFDADSQYMNMRPALYRYWHKRYSLFHKFDQGIWMDEGKVIFYEMIFIIS